MKIEKGTKVLVTGAASGIGRAVALAAATRGAALFLTDRNEEGLLETAEMAKRAGSAPALCRAFDLADLQAVRSFAEHAHREHGPMEVVMNVAGIALFALVEDMTHEHWEKVIKVNLWGPIHVIECFLPEMIKAKRGHLVNVSSAAGIMGAPWHAAYAAAKAGLAGLSEVLFFDLKQHNIGVTLVCPGAVDTPLKHTVEILGGPPGVNPDDVPAIQRMKERFTERAIPPEKVASQILNAVEKNQFLLITSYDIKLMFFLKRFAPPLYRHVMGRISRLLNNTKKAALEYLASKPD